VSPRYAIVSVGRHNLFGHPAPQTLTALREADSLVYRTDENGAIEVHTDGSSIAIRNMIDDARGSDR
jgi:competence protein ComEC